MNNMRTAAVLAFRTLAILAFTAVANVALAAVANVAFAAVANKLWKKFDGEFSFSVLIWLIPVAGGVLLWRWAPRLAARVVPESDKPDAYSGREGLFQGILPIAVSVVALFLLWTALWKLASVVYLSAYVFRREIPWSWVLQAIVPTALTLVLACAIGLVLLFKARQVAVAMARLWPPATEQVDVPDR